MRDTTLLLMGDDAGMRNVVRKAIQGVSDCRCESAQFSDGGLARLARGGVSIVVVAMNGTASGDRATEILTRLREAWPQVPVLVLCSNIDTACELKLLRMGVVECLSPPFNVSRLRFLVDILTVRARCVAAGLANPCDTLAIETEMLDGLVVVSEPARQLLGQLRRVAPLESTILLTGETGTGKTALARLVHRLSPRRDAPFLVVNCGALSPTLIESELFGHKRGAFTGADQDRIGKLEQVQDGTLLLDEIDGLPPALQAKLLRAVEERVFEPVGSNESRPVRARLVAATNRNLEDEVAEGRFRADLYFRLNVIDFVVPPLRERRTAIPQLAEKYLESFAASHHFDRKSLSAEALAALTSYDWPGNVRELRNVIERISALAPESVIEVSDLPPAMQRCAGDTAQAEETGTDTNGLARARRQAERARLSEALMRNRNNRSHAASDLGISRVTLYKKLHLHGLA